MNSWRPGIVEAFDRDAGLGTIRDGSETYPFHCTQIADGSRDIEVGAEVAFVVMAGRAGRWEAGAVTPREGGALR